MISLDLQEHVKRGAIVKVVGVGGGGGNTVNNIILSGQNNIEFIVVNTDEQALDLSKAPHKVRIGMKSTKGLGTGANPELGKRAAEEDLEKILEAIGDADIVFLAAGMGGGTGSGAMPVIAHALKEKGILSIAVVTKPFLFEGKRRCRVADQALEDLEQYVDTLLVIPNQRLLDVVDETVSMIDAFSMINDILGQSVKGIVDIISKPGHINVDFADVRAIMKDRGLAVMGTATASGPNRAREATLKAISSPLLENMDIQGAHGVLLNISGGKDLGLHEMSQAASVIYEKADEDAHIIMGSVIDEALDQNGNNEIQVTIIATGFNRDLRAKDADSSIVEQVVHASRLDHTEKESRIYAKQSVEKQHAEIAQSISHHNEQLIAEQAQEKELAPKQTDADQKHYAIVDQNDLDIPTFLRKQAQQVQEDN